MRLLSLSLQTFRSYEKLELLFAKDQHVSLFVGENATGKTNILEAISILGLLKPLRKANRSEEPHV